MMVRTGEGAALLQVIDQRFDDDFLLPHQFVYH